MKQPQTADEVDEQDYFDANPDVQRSTLGAAEHFALHGKQEGRVQYANRGAVADMREEKLKRLRLRRPAKPGRLKGAALDFLTPQLVAEFGIPEAPPVSMNQYGGPFIDEIAAHPERLCLDVGAGYRFSYAENVVNVDIYPSLTTDVLCVGEDLPFASDQFDYVICCAVLEHTRRPWDVAREIVRVLKPGGKVLVDYPFLQGVHGYPHHYFNATPQGAISLFEEQCEILESSVLAINHPIHALYWLLQTWRHGLEQPTRDRFEAMTIGALMRKPSLAQINEDYCAGLSLQAVQTIPSGSTLIARKKVESGTLDDMGRIDALEAELAAVRGSRSWKLTAPLRALVDWRRRRR